MSESANLLYGVPQGSVLGSLFYVLYTAELLDVIAELGFTAHAYADDTQIYIGTPAADVANAVQGFTDCVDRVCTPVSAITGRRHLRSASSQLLFVPSYRTTLGSRSFAVCGPTVWNISAALR